MVDIETLGNGNDAVITSIGACVFDPSASGWNAELSLPVDPQSCIEIGMKMDVGTVLWWLGQEKAAQQEIIKEPRFSIQLALAELKEWASEHNVEAWWSHGVTFDLVILQAAYRLAGINSPIPFRSMLDTRTLFALSGPVPKEVLDLWPNTHIALDDAKRQVMMVQWAWKQTRHNGEEQ